MCKVFVGVFVAVLAASCLQLVKCERGKLYAFYGKFFKVEIESDVDRTTYSIQKNGSNVQLVELERNFGKNISIAGKENGFTLHGFGQSIDFTPVADTIELTLVRVERRLHSSQSVSDCFRLMSHEGTHWFGGAEAIDQLWPIEKMSCDNCAYLPDRNNKWSVAERYWLNSNGSFVYVDSQTPLFIDQNVRDSDSLCLKVDNRLPYNVRRDFIPFVYHIGIGKNATAAHLHAVNRFLSKPTDVPDEYMIYNPIWSTWARYKRLINETAVKAFAQEILTFGLEDNQLEIDDNWEDCYGSLKFDATKFPDVKGLVAGLKANKFRVTLWIHPFINKGCDDWLEANQNG